MNEFPKIDLTAQSAAEIDGISGKYQSQLDRFKEAARKTGPDESKDALDKVFGKLDLKQQPEGEKAEKKDYAATIYCRLSLPYLASGT